MTRSHAPDAGERAFRALLRLYPRSFRARFGEEMAEFYLDQRLEPRHNGSSFAEARLWLHLIADIGLSAPVEHWRAFTRTPTDRPSWASPDYPPQTYPMETLRQDIKYALRSIALRPGFAAIAVLTLALGIGATTSIFSVVDAVLLRPLPWPDSDRLVMIFGARGASNRQSVVYLDFQDWRQQSTAFEEMGPIRGQSVNLTGTETPERLIGSFVTAGTLRALGATPLTGRLFTERETEVATREPSAILNEAVWRTRYGSRPDMLGRSLVINGQPFTVVGIMKPGFSAPLGTPDVWLPMGYYPNQGDLTTRGRGGVILVGKLKPGLTVERGQSDLDAIAKRLAAEYPATNDGTGAAVLSLKEQIAGPSRTPLFIVLASVATVLLIACANVANLQLARATARRRELTVRAALGAGRHRIMRQLLTESLVLSALGGVAGIGIASLGVRWFASVVPNLLPMFGTITLDRSVLAFAALVTIATGIMFGITPAWRASKAQLQDALSTRSGSGAIRLHLHHALVVGQLALCVVLLVSAGLLTRSLMALTRVNPGFDVDRLITLQFRLPVTKYDSDAKIADMFTRTIAEIRTVPGVEHAAVVRATPLNGNGERFPYEVEGSAGVAPDKLPQAHRNLISSGYFETMRIPRMVGRDFTGDDRQGSMPVAIVNEQLARKLAPIGSAIGARFRLMDSETPVPLTVVGVVGNAKHFQISEQQVDQVYLPYQQKPLIFTEIVARVSGDLAVAGNAVRGAIWRVDRDQPVWRIRPVALSIEGQLGARSFMMRLIGSFSVVALILAVIGVYGVMSYAVARRSQEMGIRIALGARGPQVVGMVVRQGMRTIGIAIGIGTVGAFGATRLLESQLYGVNSIDPLTFVAVPLTLAGVALVACFIPARRASRVDPVVALRSD
jgi:putative ABC transport system permease protein